jgi:hypothetical protein
MLSQLRSGALGAGRRGWGLLPMLVRSGYNSYKFSRQRFFLRSRDRSILTVDAKKNASSVILTRGRPVFFNSQCSRSRLTRRVVVDINYPLRVTLEEKDE